jgi:hypothetical protein
MSAKGWGGPSSAWTYATRPVPHTRPIPPHTSHSPILVPSHTRPVLEQLSPVLKQPSPVLEQLSPVLEQPSPDNTLICHVARTLQ